MFGFWRPASRVRATAGIAPCCQRIVVIEVASGVTHVHILGMAVVCGVGQNLAAALGDMLFNHGSEIGFVLMQPD